MKNIETQYVYWIMEKKGKKKEKKESLNNNNFRFLRESIIKNGRINRISILLLLKKKKINKLLPWQIPYFRSTIHNVLLTSGDHLIGDFHKKCSHSFGCVVVERYTVYHTNTVHQARYVFNHLQLEMYSIEYLL